MRSRSRGGQAVYDTSPIIGTFDQTALLDRSTKHTAPEVVVPQGADWQTAWARLEDMRRSFLDVFLSGDGLALGEVIHTQLLQRPFFPTGAAYAMRTDVLRREKTLFVDPLRIVTPGLDSAANRPCMAAPSRSMPSGINGSNT